MALARDFKMLLVVRGTFGQVSFIDAILRESEKYAKNFPRVMD